MKEGPSNQLLAYQDLPLGLILFSFVLITHSIGNFCFLSILDSLDNSGRRQNFMISTVYYKNMRYHCINKSISHKN